MTGSLMTAIRFKTCSGCQNVRHIDNYHKTSRGLYGRNSKCKPCVSAYHKIRNSKPGASLRTKANWLSRYNMTLGDFDYMVEAQGGKCAICGTTEPGGRFNAWQVDHDHRCCDGPKSCGRCVRGLLCYKCNYGLGSMQDDPEIIEKAAAYVRSGMTQLLTGVDCG